MKKIARQSKSADHGRRGAKPPGRRPTNLSLESEAIVRGEEYARRHGTSLSQLVSDLLRALPAGSGEVPRSELAPAVRRLSGIAAGSAVDRETHREHLLAKYGGRGRR